MIIKTINAKQLMERHANWGQETSFQETYQVLAIRIRRRKKQYLVADDLQLKWWDSDLFEVIVQAIPKDWITVQYARFHKFKNKNYDFDISTTYYQGPQEFLDNEDFLFDIYENPTQAYNYYYQYLQKVESRC